jgi:response regulator RpfG family c-di-GMP phosphodiesterase
MKNLSILIVDDEIDVLNTLYLLISTARREDTFYKTKSALEAKKLIENDPHRFDLVISDIKMDELSGVELSTFIKKVSPQTRIFLTSGYLNIIEELQLFDLGIEKIFLKPLVLEELLEAIELNEIRETLKYSQMTAVNIEALKLKEKCPFDLYVGIRSDKIIKIFNKNSEVDVNKMEYFLSNHIHHLYTKTETIINNVVKFYVPVRVSNFKINTKINFTVYYLIDNAYIELIPPNVLITEELLNVVLKHNIKTLFIEDHCESLYIKYLDTVVQAMLNSSELSLEDKGMAVFQLTSTRVKEVFSNPTKDNIAALGTSQKHLMSFLKNEKGSLSKLIKMNEKNHGIHVHCSMVASISYAILLEISNMREDNELKLKIRALDEYVFDSDDAKEIIFIGAILHDIGKSLLHLSDTIIQKSEDPSVNPAVFEVFKSHPQVAYEKLKELNLLPHQSLEIVKNHEENCDGTGYPNNLTKPEISFFTQVVSLANFVDNERSRFRKSNLEILESVNNNLSKFNKHLLPVLERVLL